MGDPPGSAARSRGSNPADRRAAAGRCSIASTASARGVNDDLVTRDTTIMVTNAAGTDPTAGWPSSESSAPGSTRGNATDVTGAPSDSPPPTINPLIAPAVVSPRHQIPSTSSG